MITEKTIKESLCADCENGCHGMTQSGCACTCHGVGAEFGPTAVYVPEGETLDAVLSRAKDEPEETLLDVRLANAQRDAGKLIELLQQAQKETADNPRIAALLWDLIYDAQHVENGLAELISTRGK